MIILGVAAFYAFATFHIEAVRDSRMTQEDCLIQMEQGFGNYFSALQVFFEEMDKGKTQRQVQI